MRVQWKIWPWLGLGLVLALCRPGDVAAATGGIEAAPADRLDGLQLRDMFDRKSDAGQRAQGLRELVRLAQAGHGYPAFYLGVLYRHGMEHPARLVERDVETARHWLLKCVEAQHCPLMALASLAELELADGNAKAAMQWAQAWVALDREVDKRADIDKHARYSDAAYRETSYHAYLLRRCYRAMDGIRNPDVVGEQWFDELIRARGKQLGRMLADNDAAVGSLRDGQVRISAENQRRKVVEAGHPTPFAPAIGLYLYEASPAGGRARSVFVVEALPKPSNARGLDAFARNTRTKPVAGDAGGQAYALMPMSYDDGGHSLVPTD